MTKTLEQQIVKALTADDPPPTLDQLLTLISEVESAIIEAENAAEIAREQFLDPIACPDANAGRAKLESTQFTSARLRTLLPRLQAKAREVEAEEDRQEWLIDFRALAEERNALAKELRETYPAAVATLVSLFARVADLDHRLSALHGSRPSGAKGTLLGAELVARDLDEFSRDTPSLTRELRLPDWQESNRLIWPPRELPASVLLAEAVAAVHDPRRYSSEWPEALREEKAKRIAEEQKRIEQEAARAAEDKAAYEASLPR